MIEGISAITLATHDMFPQILRYALAGKKGVFLVRITPEVISVLDYRKGFGHTDLVKL